MEEKLKALEGIVYHLCNNGQEIDTLEVKWEAVQSASPVTSTGCLEVVPNIKIVYK